MTPRERLTWKILCYGVVPAAVLAADVALYVLMRGWTYSVKEHGAAAFWPGVLMFGALFFPLAAAALAKALYDLANARASTRWPAVEGRVTDSAVKPMEHSRRAWIGWETYYTYLPSVAYEYEAAGQHYKNDLTAFGLTSFDTSEEAEAVLARYPKGAPVRVHYDPDDPQASVLQSTGGWAFRTMIAAVFLAAIPFSITIMAVTQR